MNIFEIKPFKVEIFKKNANLALKSDFIGKSTVVGAYLRPYLPEGE